MVFDFLKSAGAGIGGLLQDPQQMAMLQMGAELMAQGGAGATTGEGIGAALNSFATNTRRSRMETLQNQMFDLQRQEMMLKAAAMQQEAQRAQMGGFAGDSIDAQIMNELVSQGIQSGLDPVSARRAAIDRYQSSKSQTVFNQQGLPVTLSRQPLFSNTGVAAPAAMPQAAFPQAPSMAQGIPAQPMAVADTPEAQAAQAMVGLGLSDAAGGGLPANVADPMYRGLRPNESLPPALPEMAQVGGVPSVPIPAYDPMNPAASQAALEEANKANIELQKQAGISQLESAAKRKELLPKAKASLLAFEDKSKTVMQKIDESLNALQASPASAGFRGEFFKMAPETTAREVKNNLETIKANIGFDELSNMRANSPTGGALGNVTERETALLQAVRGALDQGSPEQLARNLQELKQLYRGSAERMREALVNDFGDIDPDVAKTYRPKTLEEYLSEQGF